MFKQRASVFPSKSFCFSQIKRVTDHKTTTTITTLNRQLYKHIYSSVSQATLVISSLLPSVLKSFVNRSWACRVGASNVNDSSISDSKRPTVCLKAVFTKAKSATGLHYFHVARTNFYWAWLTYVRQNGKTNLSDPRNRSLPSTHTDSHMRKRNDRHKHKAHRVCLLTCVYTKLSHFQTGNWIFAHFS